LRKRPVVTVESEFALDSAAINDIRDMANLEAELYDVELDPETLDEIERAALESIGFEDENAAAADIPAPNIAEPAGELPAAVPPDAAEADANAEVPAAPAAAAVAAIIDSPTGNGESGAAIPETPVSMSLKKGRRKGKRRIRIPDKRATAKQIGISKAKQAAVAKANEAAIERAEDQEFGPSDADETLSGQVETRVAGAEQPPKPMNAVSLVVACGLAAVVLFMIIGVVVMKQSRDSAPKAAVPVDEGEGKSRDELKREAYQELVWELSRIRKEQTSDNLRRGVKLLEDFKAEYSEDARLVELCGKKIVRFKELLAAITAESPPDSGAPP